MTRAAWAAIAAAIVALGLVLSAGAAGLAYGLLYAIAVLPGVQFGRAMLGRATIAGWLAGAALGYGGVQLSLWLPIFAGVPSTLALVTCWVIVSLLFLAGSRRSAPLVDLPPSELADLRALALVLLLVPMLMGPPYHNLGGADEEGTRYYRAYFTADFVWHTALASELGKYDTPPRNPYYASQEMHYYWTYFLLPAVAAAEAPRLFDVQPALKSNAVCTAALVLGLLFAFTRLAVPRASLAAAAVVLGVVASSAEGALVLSQVARGIRTLDSVRDINIDAVTAWPALTGWPRASLRVDDLPRGFWYNPQHSMACGLGLIALIVAASAGAAASLRTILFAGLALGLATCVNPFVGGVFAVIYGLAVAVDAARTQQWTAIARHACAAGPMLLALGWVALNGIVEGASGAVSFGLRGYARNQPISALLLSTGPILLPAVAGLWPSRGLPARPAWTAGGGLVLALLLMHFVVLSEASWVGFRTGQILLLMAPALVARSLFGVWRRSRLAAGGVCLLVMVAGAPTTAIDTFNAQDIENLRMGPGFPWTLSVSPAQQQAFAWVRAETPPDAIVQMEPILRGRAHWSLIPTFAERRMIAGLPISLLPMPEYQQQSLEVRRVYATPDAREAWLLCRELGIDYLYADRDDRAAYPAGLAKFDGGSGYFVRAYSASGVTIYAVR